jgi:hypothetical protein
MYDDGPIPRIEHYKGIGIMDCQPRERIETIVKREIDEVLAEGGIERLARIAGDATWSPEARLLSAAKCEALWQLCAEERRSRPVGVELDVVQASVAGLDCIGWRSPWAYGSLLDVPAGPGERGAAPREEPFITEVKEQRAARLTRRRPYGETRQ